MTDFIDRFNSYPLGQKILGLVLIMCLIGVGAFFLLLKPKYEKQAQLKAQFQELQRQKESLDQLKRNRALVLAQLEQLQRQLLIAQEKLPRGAEIPSLLQRIHNQAKTAGLEILRFQRNPDRPRDFYVEIPVQMELRGTFDELANFFYYVGRMTRIVNVKDISLGRKESGLTPSGQLQVSALATTFRYKSDEEMSGKKKKGRQGRR